MQEYWILKRAGRRAEILARRNRTSIDGTKVRLKLLARHLLGEQAKEVPVRRRDERHSLPLALHDQPHCYALYAAGRELGTHFPPQQGRDFVPVQPIDNPPSF